jgi:hypothetical protein
VVVQKYRAGSAVKINHVKKHVQLQAVGGADESAEVVHASVFLVKSIIIAYAVRILSQDRGVLFLLDIDKGRGVCYNQEKSRSMLFI